jgi:AcrR family transcriptional regulator
LDRGYAGTPVNAITEACGISRPCFYTYFKSKREVFNVLGKNAYREVLALIAEWAEAERALGRPDVKTWVTHYFDYMDRHGAFVLASAHSAPDDEEFRNARNRMLTRATWKLGQAIDGDGAHSPDVLGVAVMGLLDSAWHSVHRQTVPVDRDEMIAVVAEMVTAMAASQRPS